MSDKSGQHIFEPDTLQALHLPALPPLPLVSILIASYNYESFIREALQSTLKQSYEKLEILVIDDGSTDASCEIVADFVNTDDRVRLIRKENAGVASALNRGIEESQGEIVCLLDADDFFMPAKVASVVAKMQAYPQAGFVQHAMEVVDAAGQLIRKLPAHNLFEEGWIAAEVIKRGGRWRNMPASALSFRREVADLIFPMPADQLKSMADAYLYMLAPLLTHVGYLSNSLSAYRLHGNNLTGSLHFDAKTSEKYTEGIRRVHDSVDKVVELRSLKVPSLDAQFHLTNLEHEFMYALFTGEQRRILWMKYGQLSKATKADDLYPPARKILGRVVLGFALFLPVRWRSRWVTWGLGGWRK